MDKNVVVSNKLKSSNDIPFLRENLIKNNENKEESKYGKNDNINNENKNNANDNNDELILSLNDDKPKNNTDENKVKSSNELNHIIPRNKNKLFIDCNNNVFKSNSNLPKINLIFETSIKNADIANDKIKAKNLKYYSSKEVVNNKFLKTNQKTKLNPIIKKNTIVVPDNKTYFLSNFSNNKNSGFKPKEDLDKIRKSLFCGNGNDIKRNSKEAIVIINNTKNKMKSSTIMPQISIFENLVHDDLKDIKDIEEEIKNNYNDINNDNKKREKCKSKEKSKNNLVGKETKTIVSNRRYQSTNNRKKKL